MDPVSVVTWTAIIAVVWSASIPIAWHVFPDRPRAAGALALPVGLTIVGLAGYWIGQFVWGVTGAILAILPVFVGGVIAWRRGAIVRVPVGGIVVFVVTAGVLLTVRTVDPVPVPGTPIIDMNFLEVMTHGATLPRPDRVFAGEVVPTFSYGGSIVIAVITLVSTAPIGAAFPLAQGLLFGALATGAYGVGAAVAGGPSRTDPRVAGGLTTLFVVGAGPLATPVRLLVARGLPYRVVEEWASPLFAEPLAPGTSEVIRLYASGFPVAYARSIPPEMINAFPAWAFLDGGFEQTMVGAPFLVVVVALCFPLRNRPAADRRHRYRVLLALIGVGGFLTLANPWAIPTLVGLVWLALLTADAPPQTLYPATIGSRLGPDEGVQGAVRRILLATPIALVVGALAVLIVAPTLVVTPPAGLGLVLAPKTGTTVLGLVLVYGVFLAGFTLWLGPQLWSAAQPNPALAAVITGTILAVAALIYVAGYPGVAVFAPLLLTTMAMTRYGDGGYAIMLIGAGAATIIITSLLQVSTGGGTASLTGTGVPQVWILWGIPTGVFVAAVLERVRTQFEVATDWRAALHPAATGILMVLILLAALTFAAAALFIHFEASLTIQALLY